MDSRIEIWIDIFTWLRKLFYKIIQKLYNTVKSLKSHTIKNV